MTATNLWQSIRIALIAALCSLPALVSAHHSVPAEFGSDTPIRFMEAKVVSLKWGNPHIFINVETVSGDVPAGENWRLTAHPVNIMSDTYGIEGSDFKPGDTVRVYGRLHIRQQPLMQIRAIAINDGPMRSALEHRDLQDLASGDLEKLGIVPSPSLEGSEVNRRVGPDTVEILKQKGLVDDNNIVHLNR